MASVTTKALYRSVTNKMIWYFIGTKIILITNKSRNNKSTTKFQFSGIMWYLNRRTRVWPIVGMFSNKSIKMTDAVGVLVCTLLPTVLTSITASTLGGRFTVFVTPKLQGFINGQSNVFQEKSIHYLHTAEESAANSERNECTQFRVWLAEGLESF